MALIAFFDFLSHGGMHVPYNLGHIRVLREAFPDDQILVAADAGQIESLRPALSGIPHIEFQPVELFELVRTGDAHLPWRGRPAARRSWAEVERVLAGRRPRLGVLGGMDANLLAVFRRRWQQLAPSPLHYVLHSHLAMAHSWRSRNPILRSTDFISVFRRGLPPGQFILAIELSIADSIEQSFPAMRGHCLTMEHPVLQDELQPFVPPAPDRPFRLGFCGHCGKGKGFDFFVDMARQFAGEKMTFHAIGALNPNVAGMDLSSLSRKPSAKGLARDAFTAALGEVDMVCLPLGKDPRFVASGSIIDAFSAGKPLLVTNNPMLQAIAGKYGEFGVRVDDRAGIRTFLETFERTAVIEKFPIWNESITRIRAARTPSALAAAYPKPAPC